MEKQPNQLKWGERIAFIGGEFYGGGAVPIMSGIYMSFLIFIVKISPIAAGAIIFASKLWDAITDPLMGVISDNTRCKYGRRKPWLFLGACLVIPGMLLLFAPGYMSGMNEGAKIATCLFAYLAYSTISTIFNVPYVSFTSEFSTNIEERSTVNAIRIVLAMISGGICLMFPSMVFDAYVKDHTITLNTFYLIIALVFGLYFAIPMFCVSIFTKERVPYDKDHKEAFSWKKFFEPLKVKAFTMLIVMYTFSFACMDLISAQLLIFLGSALPTISAMSIYLVLMITGGVCMPILKIVMNKGVSKNTIFKIGIPFYLIGVMGLAFFPNDPKIINLVYIFAAIAGIGFGCVQMIPWLIFPDLCDVGELKLKQPNAGSFSAIMTFTRKVASGLGVFLVTVGLQSIGFNPYPETEDFQQPENAIQAIRIIMAVSAGVFLTLAFLGSMAMKLTKQLTRDVKELLDIQRRDGNLDAMTEEQAIKYEVIKKKLF